MIANKVIANKSDSKQKEAKPWDDKQMRMNLLRQRLRGLIKFVSCHNQNDAHIKHPITKVFIRKVLKQSKERAQPLERADEKRANKKWQHQSLTNNKCE